jgi:hypothetical protein
VSAVLLAAISTEHATQPVIAQQPVAIAQRVIVGET